LELSDKEELIEFNTYDAVEEFIANEELTLLITYEAVDANEELTLLSI